MEWRQGKLALCSFLKNDNPHVQGTQQKPTSALKFRMTGLKMRASFMEDSGGNCLFHSGLPSITQNVGACPDWGILLIQSQFMFGNGDVLKKSWRGWSRLMLMVFFYEELSSWLEATTKSEEKNLSHLFSCFKLQLTPYLAQASRSLRSKRNITANSSFIWT